MPLPIGLALLAALATAPEPLPPGPPLAPRPASAWELGTSLSGGWDSNPLAATEPAGSGFASASAWVARELRATDDDLVWLQLRFDGTRHDALGDADLDRPELSVEWGHRLGPSLELHLSATGALREAAGIGRSGWDAGARAMLRLRLGDRVALRAGGGWLRLEASDPAYATSTGRLEAGVDADLWRGASALARYALELGTGATSTAGAGRRGGGGSSGGAVASRVANGISLDLRQELGAGLFLQAGCGAAVVRDGETSRVEQQAVAEIGVRR